MSAAEEFGKLVEIMKKLRVHCPWDREQDHGTLRQYLLEETYEVLEALDKRDYQELRGELGDVLLQVVFQSEVAEEKGEFAIEDVIKGISQKLIRRHPHVFAEVDVSNSDDVVENWEMIKTRKEDTGSRLAGVPQELPALLKAVRVLEKMRRAGLKPFDGQDPADVARERIEELEKMSDEPEAAETERIASGALLACARLCSSRGVNPEDALRSRVSHMVDAFQALEERLKAEGRELEDLDEDELTAAAESLLEDSHERQAGNVESEGE